MAAGRLRVDRREGGTANRARQRTRTACRDVVQSPNFKPSRGKPSQHSKPAKLAKQLQLTTGQRLWWLQQQQPPREGVVGGAGVAAAAHSCDWRCHAQATRGGQRGTGGNGGRGCGGDCEKVLMECSQTTWAAAASSRRRRAAQHKKAVQHKCSDALLLHYKAMCVTVTAIDTENHQWKNNYARTHTHNHALHMHTYICTSVECKERVQKIGAHTKCKMGKKEAENNKNKAKTKAIVNYKCPKSGWGCCCCCRQRLRIVFEVEQQPRQHSLGSTSSSADKDDGFEILLDAARSFCCCCGCCFLLKLHMHRC